MNISDMCAVLIFTIIFLSTFFLGFRVGSRYGYNKALAEEYIKLDDDESEE
jgi:cbb3-type cytochrome oxidase subunit 3